MDRNQFIGLALMLVMLTVYFQFFSPEVPEPPAEVDNVVATPNPVDTLTQVSTPTQRETLSDSALSRLNEMKYGIFSAAAIGEAEKIPYETEDLRVIFSTQGGSIQSVELLGYQKFDGSPLVFVDGGHQLDLYFEHLSRPVNKNELYFQSSSRDFGDSTEVYFDLNVDGNQLRQVYTLYAQGYAVGYRLESQGFEKLIDAKDLVFTWSAHMAQLEREVKDARTRTTVRYYALDGETDYLSKSSNSHEEERVESSLKWLSFNQKFFTAAIIADKSFSSALITLDMPTRDDIIKIGGIQASIPFTDVASGSASFEFFFGPNKYKILKNVTEGFSENIELGWLFLPAINKFLIIPIFNMLEGVMSNYGLIIIIMVLIIRILLSPLTYKSHISMAKMRVLKPELDELKEEMEGDMQKLQTAQMDLYRKAGINPLSGCIPVLLQFPILVSLFYFIPSAIELRMESFLWADDLSSYDSILRLPFTIPFYGSHVSLFTLLMAGSTVLYTVANSQMTTVQGPMKTMQYIMPVMLLFFFNSYPSGLSYYYFISNIVSYGQIALFRKFIDEDKIHRIMQENKKKNANKKKSKFQQRLEDAMKASQEQQQQRKKTKKK